MVRKRKFNPSFKIGGFIPVVTTLVLFAFATSFMGISAGLVVVLITFSMYALFSLWAYAYTRNIGYFAAFLFQSLMAIYLLTVPYGLMPLGKKEAWFFYFCGIIVMVWLIYLMFTGKGKWKGKSVFELAAIQVHEVLNGYTERPRPAGKLQYTKSELFGFAEFLKRNLIALPYVEANGIVFVPVMMGDEYVFLLKLAGDYHYYSWIAFDFDGNVSASMAKKDYLSYTEEFSFDQLCNSLGKLFMEFMEYYKKDETERIMHKFNSLRFGFFG